VVVLASRLESMVADRDSARGMHQEAQATIASLQSTIHELSESLQVGAGLGVCVHVLSCALVCLCSGARGGAPYCVRLVFLCLSLLLDFCMRSAVGRVRRHMLP
jgi:hypothetical protein